MPYTWLQIALELLRGIEPHDVTQALQAERRLVMPGTSGGYPIIVVCARTRAGRPLMIGLRKTGTLDQEIVGARDLNPNELAEFEKWEAHHD